MVCLRLLIVFAVSMMVDAEEYDDFEEVIDTPSALSDSAKLEQKNVNIEQHPYQVAVQTYGAKPYYCGGAILNKRFVVTAARCVMKRVKRVKVGTNYERLCGYTATVKNVIVHPDYNYNTDENDVALIELNEDLPFSNKINRVLLHSGIEPSAVNRGVVANFTGYGIAGSHYRRLQKVPLKTLGYKDCQDRYSKSLLTKDKFCGVGSYAFCKGNYGDPLVYNYRLYGLLSWRRDCSTKRLPAIFSYLNMKALKFISATADVPIER